MSNEQEIMNICREKLCEKTIFKSFCPVLYVDGTACTRKSSCLERSGRRVSKIQRYVSCIDPDTYGPSMLGYITSGMLEQYNDREPRFNDRSLLNPLEWNLLWKMLDDFQRKFGHCQSSIRYDSIFDSPILSTSSSSSFSSLSSLPPSPSLSLFSSSTFLHLKDENDVQRDEKIRVDNENDRDDKNNDDDDDDDDKDESWCFVSTVTNEQQKSQQQQQRSYRYDFTTEAVRDFVYKFDEIFLALADSYYYRHFRDQINAIAFVDSNLDRCVSLHLSRAKGSDEERGHWPQFYTAFQNRMYRILYPRAFLDMNDFDAPINTVILTVSKYLRDLLDKLAERSIQASIISIDDYNKNNSKENDGDKYKKTEKAAAFRRFKYGISKSFKPPVYHSQLTLNNVSSHVYRSSLRVASKFFNGKPIEDCNSETVQSFVNDVVGTTEESFKDNISKDDDDNNGVNIINNENELKRKREDDVRIAKNNKKIILDVERDDPRNRENNADNDADFDNRTYLFDSTSIIPHYIDVYMNNRKIANARYVDPKASSLSYANFVPIAENREDGTNLFKGNEENEEEEEEEMEPSLVDSLF